MKRVVQSLALALALLWGQTSYGAYEWYHHNFDMSYYLYVCMDSCFQTDNTGAYTVTDSDEQDDVLLASIDVVVNLSETCYSNPIQMTGAISVTNSMAVTAQDWVGGSVQYGVSGNGGWDIGESAKASVGGSINWTHSWNWVVTGTYTESFTMTASATVPWPQSGSRLVTGPGASITLPVKAYGNTASFTLEARRQHFCTTTIKHTVYTNEAGQHICNSWIEGDVVITTYSGHGDVRFSATASGHHPDRLELGAIIEAGPIQVGCDT